MVVPVMTLLLELACKNRQQGNAPVTRTSRARCPTPPGVEHRTVLECAVPNRMASLPCGRVRSGREETRCVLIPDMSGVSSLKDMELTQGEGAVGGVVSLPKGYDL